jgi:DNA helicase HerA-like ATPase
MSIRRQARGYIMDLSSVRIREHYGLVSNDTHTGQFSFLVSPPKGRASVEKHDYVLIDHPLFGEACQVLAVITDITSYEEVAGSTIGDKMGKMLATAEIEGYVDLRKENKPFCEVLVPPNPGCRVYLPLKTFLEDILNRNTQGEGFKTPIEIGIFENSSAEDQEKQGRIKCFLDAQDLTSKHSLIAAGPGAGKTRIAKVLLQEISSKTSAQIIIFDPYNEYSDAIETAKKIEINNKTDKDSLTKMIKKGLITVLNAQGLGLEGKRSFFLEFLQIILKLRLENKVMPLFLIIEEAENLEGEILNRAIAEGRKIGISTCLLTTNPSELGGKILSQMGYQIIGKTINKEDIVYLSNIAGATNSLADLSIGEWIVKGISKNKPIKLCLS